MIEIINYMQFCRLCLVKEKVNVPIFDNTNDDKQLFLKITQCLPVKVSPDDKLPKNICESCLHKVDSLYQFQNMTVNSEKQLVQWLKEVGIDISDKPLNQARLECTNHQQEQHSIHTDIVMKQEQDLDTLNVNAHTYQNQSYQDYNMTFSQMASDTASAFPQAEVSQPADGAYESDRGTQPDNSEDDAITGNRIAKEEVESEEDYDESGDTLEPTAFVGVPSRSVSDEERPGPSGLSKPGPNSGLPVKLPNGIRIKEAKKSNGKKSVSVYEQIMTKLRSLPFINIKEETEQIPDTSTIVQKLCKSGLIVTKVSDINATTQYRHTFNAVENYDFSDTESEYEIEALDDDIEFLLPLQKYLKKEDLSSDIPAKPPENIFSTDQNVPPLRPLSPKNSTESNLNNVPSLRVLTSNFLNNEPPPLVKISSKIVKSNEKISDEEIELLEDEFLDQDVPPLRVLSPVNLDTKTFDKNEEKLCKFKTLQKNNEFIKVKNTNYLCVKCGTKFNTLDELQAHNISTIPCPTLVYPCKICNKAFTKRGKLNLHFKLHIDRQSFSCSKCNKKLANKIAYRIHMESNHTEHFDEVENGYKCKYCSKIQETKRQIVRHVNQNHHHITTYLCDICGKKFYQKNGFQHHVMTHRETKSFLCQICSKAFKTKSSLTVHLKTHSSERLYICDECGKSFKKGFTLREHKKHHAGEFSYSCSICDKRFVSKTTLNSHLKNHP